MQGTDGEGATHDRYLIVLSLILLFYDFFFLFIQSKVKVNGLDGGRLDQFEAVQSARSLEEMLCIFDIPIAREEAKSSSGAVDAIDRFERSGKSESNDDQTVSFSKKRSTVQDDMTAPEKKKVKL